MGSDLAERSGGGEAPTGGNGVKRLERKTAVVTGAANGIGRATVERFAAEGATVFAIDRDISAAAELERVTWLVADVTKPGEVERAAAEAGRSDGIDICVANAGVGMIEPFVEGSRDSWMRVFDVNLLGVMLTLQAGARSMVETGRGGRLLVTASISGLRGEAVPSTAYAASKAGVMSLMRHLAVELAPHQITANAVAPGQIDTVLNYGDLEVMGSIVGRSADDLRAEMLETIVPAHRMGHPAEVANVFAFLASDEAAFITGETIRIDGGELVI
jgi:NAD(P)-dependent dehydrogenase (short-subunit alcohol dehydrogenase family)